MSTYSRKDFLKTGAIGSLFLGTGMGISGCESAETQSRPGKAKNVIVLVSDGMSIGTLAMADIMLKRQTGVRSNWLRLYEEGKVARGLMDMASANRIVTDSSAAASSWGGGHRVNNGSVNVGPDGTHHKPVLPIFRDAGKKTGLVTTAEITHATPAGFTANVESRNMGETIARQYLERQVDLLLGGGNRHFSSERRSDDLDLYQEFTNAGYDVVRDKQALQQIRNSRARLLGVFEDSHLPYSLDHKHILELQNRIPTISEMTDIALNKLSNHAEGFILQIEGARVDHAAHGNDAGGLLFDQIAFDEAIGTVLAFTENRDDTLVIITTDHANANPGFNSAPDENFDLIAKFTHTNEWIHAGLDENSTISQILDRVETATNIRISEDEAQVYKQAAAGDYTALYSPMGSRSAVLGQILANYTNINWTGGSHTADYVEIAAFGPGSELIGPFIKNTDLFGVMVNAAGVQNFVEAGS